MLKIECIQEESSGRLHYSGYIKYCDLVKYGFLKELTVNRITDEARLPKMEEYIRQPESIYPPIVVALEKSVKKSYNINTKELIIEKGISENSDNNILVIIDGQHRFLSIEEIIKEDNIEGFDKRKQSIFILTDMSDIEQRDLFIQINDNMKRVSSVSKNILDVTIPNYISLKTIKELDIINKVNMRNDQCTKVYPYKFILEGNKVLFKNLKIDNFDECKLLEVLNHYSMVGTSIWKRILEYIESNSSLELGIVDKKKITTNDYSIIKTEAFIKAIFCIIKDDEELHKQIVDSESDIATIDNKIEKYIKLLNNINFGDEEDIKRIKKSNKKEKEEQIARIIKNNMGESNE